MILYTCQGPSGEYLLLRGIPVVITILSTTQIQLPNDFAKELMGKQFVVVLREAAIKQCPHNVRINGTHPPSQIINTMLNQKFLGQYCLCYLGLFVFG